MTTKSLERILLGLLRVFLGVAFVESLSNHWNGCRTHPPRASTDFRSSPAVGFHPATVARITNRCHRQPQSQSQSQSRRQSRLHSSPRSNNYGKGNDDEYEYEYEYEDDFPNTKFREVSREELDLRKMVEKSSSRRRNDVSRNPNGNRMEYDNDDDDDDADYYFYDNEDEEEDRRRPRRRPSDRFRREDLDRGSQRGGRLSRYDEDVYKDDSYDDDEEEEEEDAEESGAVGGNFWSNPSRRTDRPPAELFRGGRRDQSQRSYDDYDYDDDDRLTRRPRRQRDRGAQRRNRRQQRRAPASSSGLGQPPKVLKDLYDQLFWYGFDVDESADVGDKTAFGGTKGKFNGFNYLLPERSSGSGGGGSGRVDSARRLPPSDRGAMTRDYEERRRRDDDYYDYEDDYYEKANYNGDDEVVADDSNRKRRSLPSSLYKPPTDETSVRRNRMEDNYYDENDYDDNYRKPRRASRGGSSRYNGAADYDDDYDYDDDDDDYDSMDRRSGGRRRRRQQSNSEWSPLNMIESFLGIDRDEMNYKAELYDAKMGLGKRRRQSDRRRPLPQQQQQQQRRRRYPRDNPGRPGYAYRYDAAEDEDESTPILDVDLAYDDNDDGEDDASSSSSARESRPDPGRREARSDKDRGRRPGPREQSWEERQVAAERVPPANVIAWGPTGELSVSAREKAFLDAQEDIETARRKLGAMKKKESGVGEEISILRVDAERRRVKLEDTPLDRRSRRDVEELRQIELDIDDASRELRRCRARVERALDVLEELEQRHYAILSCYNVGRASMLVGEGLGELSTPFEGSGPKSAAASATATATATTTTTATATGAGEADSSSAPQNAEN